MYELSDRVATLASRVMHAAVTASAARRYDVSVQFRASGRVIEVNGQRLRGGAPTNDEPTRLVVRLDNPYAEHLLEQMLTTVESMR